MSSRTSVLSVMRQTASSNHYIVKDYGPQILNLGNDKKTKPGQGHHQLGLRPPV